MHHHEVTLRRYFDACNAAHEATLPSCFTADAVHCFPSGLAGVPNVTQIGERVGFDEAARGYHLNG